MNANGVFEKRADGYHVVRFVRALEQSPMQVWAMLTEPAQLTKWLGDAAIEPRVGGAFTLTFNESGNRTSGVVSVFEPQRVLEYSWAEPANRTHSLVRWEIQPAPQGCVLILTHTFPPEMPRTELVSYLGGWHDFLDIMITAARGQPAPDDHTHWPALDRKYRLMVTGSEHLNEKGQSGREASVRFERLLPGPIQRVWDHLTNPKLLPAWFGDESAIEPRSGGKVMLMGGHIRGTITQWQPPNRLAYTWNVFNPGDGPDAQSAYPESYLQFTLEAAGDKVLLVLTHMPVLERFEKQNAMGWHTMLDILGATLRGEPVEERRVYTQKNAAIYGVDLANLAR